MAQSATTATRWRKKDSLWLLMAIVLHATLLLIPAFQKHQTLSSAAPLNITLIAPLPLENPFLEEVAPEKIELPTVENKTIVQDEQPIPEIESRQRIADQTEPDPPVAEVILTTARLLDSANELKWPLPDPGVPRQLGVFVPQALPDNWRSGDVIGDIILNPMIPSAKTEVVDRWFEADGSHNVIVNTSGGGTLCGRARASDPMQPLDEPVMHFRLCSGSRKRTLEMTQRIMRQESSPL
jgi:hypothetical protein